jgi:ATP-binding cassette subfamily B protein
MNLVWRLIREHIQPHAKAMLVRFLITAAVAATPYAFSFLGKWLVDEALQVTGPPKAANAPAGAERAAAAAGPVGIEWKAKTTEEKLQLLAIFLAASLGIHVLVTALSALSELLNSRTVHQLVLDMRSAVHEKLGRLEMGLFGREQVGQLMTRTLDDTGAIPGNLTNLVINVCTQVAMLVLGLVLLLRLNVQMTLIALAALPFYAVSCVVFLPRLRRNAEQMRDRAAALNGHVVERLSNIATIKNYAQEEREIASFGGLLDDNLALARHNHNLHLFFGTLTTIVTGVGTLAVLAFGFLNIKAQRMQLGEVLAFYQVTAQLFVPISALVGMTTVAQTLQVLAERVYGILDTQETLRNAPDAIDPGEVRGEIEFDDVSLRYQEGGPFAVQNVSVRIPAGTTTCIVGPTGCGKSTLIALLTRLYDPTDGAIRLDGTDIRKLRVRRLRRAIGNILHDCQVFSGTFAENLRFGAPQAGREEIEAAARLVGLHDFIESLPHGYETRVGRQGLTLGTEQLVKLAVARALVTKPAVLTVDDTFATIEEEVEQQLRSAIRAASSDQTVVVATSRLSICEDADLVIVMQRGRVIQTGTHLELLAAAGVYRRMYMRQMGMEALPD